jgi:FlaA1/EpsC-like NDP-sugar epimerase
MRSKKEIIIYGCGTVGTRVCFLLHRNDISNIVYFCDSDSNKWGSKCMGKKILSPQEAILSYPNAFFLVANRGSYMEIMRVLINLNVPRDNMGIYRLSSDPLVCTSRFI